MFELSVRYTEVFLQVFNWLDTPSKTWLLMNLVVDYDALEMKSVDLTTASPMVAIGT